MASGEGLPEHVVDGVRPCRFGALHQGSPKAHFFQFMGFNAVLANVLNAIFRPNELIDRHLAILIPERDVITGRVVRLPQPPCRQEPLSQPWHLRGTLDGSVVHRPMSCVNAAAFRIWANETQAKMNPPNDRAQPRAACNLALLTRGPVPPVGCSAVLAGP